MADVEGTPFWVECKRQKKCSIKAAIRQAEAATDGRPILVVTKNDHEPIRVTFPVTMFSSAGQERTWVTRAWVEWLTDVAKMMRPEQMSSSLSPKT